MPEMPNFNVQPPQVASPIDSYGKMLQLKALNGQQQMIPLQLQQAQEKVKQEQLATQQAQQQQQSQAAMVKAWSDPSFSSTVTSNTGKDISGSIGFEPGFNPNGMIKALVSKGVLPKDAIAQASSFLELSKNLSLKTKDDLANYKDAHEQLGKLLAPIVDMKAGDAGPALDAVKQKVLSGGIPGLDAQDIQHLQQADIGHLKPIINLLGLAGQMADFHKGQAEAAAAEAKVIDPKTGMSPEQQSIVKKDVETAKQEQPLKVALTKAEAEARQQAAQGDPNEAGRLLADGSLTLAELKTRGTTPQFIEKATAAAQKLKPGYNPADEIIAEQVAKSQSANQFFGSANSLIAKGGTLDQLEKLGKDIPQHNFPALNTVDDWQKLARGKGPLAGYAATALGVADDYGKVMGGGTASDHARDAALALFSKASSPEQRAQAIQATRGAVQSQRDSRIGNNQFLKRQYGAEVGGQANATFSIKAPNGKNYSFKDQASLDAFKQKAGIQ